MGKKPILWYLAVGVLSYSLDMLLVYTVLALVFSSIALFVATSLPATILLLILGLVVLELIVEDLNALGVLRAFRISLTFVWLSTAVLTLALV